MYECMCVTLHVLRTLRDITTSLHIMYAYTCRMNQIAFAICRMRTHARGIQSASAGEGLLRPYVFLSDGCRSLYSVSATGNRARTECVPRRVIRTNADIVITVSCACVCTSRRERHVHAHTYSYMFVFRTAFINETFTTPLNFNNKFQQINSRKIVLLLKPNKL